MPVIVNTEWMKRKGYKAPILGWLLNNIKHGCCKENIPIIYFMSIVCIPRVYHKKKANYVKFL